MNYSQLIQKLLNINLSGGMKLGLENVQRLQNMLNFPDRSFHTIHIAGTNGKGSVSIKIARALELAGYRVGLYTSPHISCFRERIKINGQMISEEEITIVLNHLFQVIEGENIPATFFEITTFLALLFFAQEKVDIAVLETGLGGRLDATNIVHPCLTVITSISLDHVDLLGTTKESIAQEKGGIIKERIPIVIGPHVPFDIIRSIAEKKQSTCIQVQPQSPLFEEENRAIAREALNQVRTQFSLSSHFIEEGLEARQPCRFEVVPGSSSIILDVAHNPDGIQRLFQMLNHHYPNIPVHLLFGLSKNKDLKTCLELIAAKGNSFHLIEATNGRGAPVSILKEHLTQSGIKSSQISLHDSIHSGLKEALLETEKQGGLLLIFGSFFIMASVRQALGFADPCDPSDLNERIGRIS